MKGRGWRDGEKGVRVEWGWVGCCCGGDWGAGIIALIDRIGLLSAKRGDSTSIHHPVTAIHQQVFVRIWTPFDILLDLRHLD